MRNEEYKPGFDPGIAVELAPRTGIDEDVVRYISAKNGERREVLDFRLAAFAHWKTMREPHWAAFEYAPIDYDGMYFFSAPKPEATPDIIAAYERLGVPIAERKILSGTAVDAVVDSRSVATTYGAELEKLGIIFCPMSVALRDHFDLAWKYFASVVPHTDNFFACLNSAAFSDGTFAYIPPRVKCPIELSSYFRLQAEKLGQFERTLIIADEGAELTYLEGCSAPIRTTQQLHSGVVELVALKGARINYATVQNWYGGDEEGRGGILNFVTKRAAVGDDAAVSWTQLEVGSAMTWKYPSCMLNGARSKGEFFSVSVTNRRQAADTGCKMIHLGEGSTSTIISRSVALGRSLNAYRGRVAIGAGGARSFTKCDSLVIGDEARAASFPTVSNGRPDSAVSHEATVGTVSDEALFHLASRGVDEDDSIGLLVNGFCGDIIKKLPAEFAMEARQLINISVEKTARGRPMMHEEANHA